MTQIDPVPSTFTGLVVPAVPIRPQDYIHGAENNPLKGLGYRVDNPTGQWGNFRPPIQIQYNPTNGFDTNDCTGFGYCRDIATYLNYKLRTNQLSANFINWMTAHNYIQNGSFLFDPRVLGIMAGTTGSGNWLQNVADAARKGGLLPAGTLPGPESGITDYTVYYDKNLITPAITALGQEFLQWIDLPYQWLVTSDPVADVQQALKACPLYVALCICGGWNSPPVIWCNAGLATNHCVTETDATIGGNGEQILDSYNPDLKVLGPNYAVPYRMMVLTAIKSPLPVTNGYKQANNATVYVKTDSGVAIPVADWQAFLNIGGNSNSVQTISDVDFANLTKAQGVLFKSN